LRRIVYPALGGSLPKLYVPDVHATYRLSIAFSGRFFLTLSYLTSQEVNVDTLLIFWYSPEL